jgi:hypothetical protein
LVVGNGFDENDPTVKLLPFKSNGHDIAIFQKSIMIRLALT